MEKIEQKNFILNVRAENDNVYAVLIWYLLREKFEETCKGHVPYQFHTQRV